MAIASATSQSLYTNPKQKQVAGFTPDEQAKLVKALEIPDNLRAASEEDILLYYNHITTNLGSVGGFEKKKIKGKKAKGTHSVDTIQSAASVAAKKMLNDKKLIKMMDTDGIYCLKK